MIIIISKYKRLVLFFLLPCFFACKKFSEVDPPKTSLSSSQLFNTDQGAISAVAGLYSQMSQVNLNFANGGITLYAGLSSDEIYNTSTNASLNGYRNNSLSSSESSIAGKFWNPAYKTIYQANAILEGLQTSPSISQPVKNQLRGEMLFVRAFHYFYLINLFADVPFVTTTDYRVNALKERTPVAAIYSAIIADLKEAKDLLSNSYPTTTKGRPNKWTAATLLARIYLYLKDWANAESEASTIINSGSYNLTTSLTDVFLPNSIEVIWQLQRDNTNTAEGISFIPSSANTKPAYSITSDLLSAFETGDNRKTTWLKKNIVGGQTYYYPYKYKVRTSSPISEYLTVFRLAEIYLIRAEARANQNKLTEGQDDVNAIRSRTGLALLSISDKSSLLAAIEHERQVELFTEWGHRWFDLKRTGRADAILSITKGSNWQTTDQLYPIPLAEILKNPFLTQNQGY